MLGFDVGARQTVLWPEQTPLAKEVKHFRSPVITNAC